MKEVFASRKQAFRNQSLKYARYVFNDHFVLFLMVFLGFLSVQYNQFLTQLPTSRWSIYLVVTVISLLLLPVGKVATYIEQADRQFLFVKEEEIVAYIKQEVKRSYLFWVILQSLCLLILFPLFLALGFPVWSFLLYLLILAFAKFLVFQQKSKSFFVGNTLNWDWTIAYEQSRRQSILRFFALFTNVKGISASVRRRPYLDIVLKLFPKNHKHTWQNLYLRSYLRNGELFSLSLRLLGLSVLVLLFVGSSWVAVCLALLFNYLLVFQLLGLYGAFDYQYLTRLFPLETGDKIRGMRQVIQRIGLLAILFQACLSLLCLADKLAAFVFIGVLALFYTVYLDLKIKKLEKE